MIEPSQLAYVPRFNEDAFKDWLRMHADWHKAIQNKAVSSGKPAYSTYALWDFSDKEDWLYWHQVEHETIANILNLPGPQDFSFLDEDDEVNWETWMKAHADTHASIRTNLGFQ